DRDAVVHVAVQRLQHEAVAAERDDGVGVPCLGRSVSLGKPLERLAGLGHLAGHEGDLLEFAFRFGHGGGGERAAWSSGWGSRKPGARMRPVVESIHVLAGPALDLEPRLEPRLSKPGTRRLAYLQQNDKAVLVYSTFPSLEAAEAEGATLVEQGLAACVNIL